MKEEIKNTKGITLVALIITIIVLLILAIVAITSINNNKILEYAKNSRDAYKQEKSNEQDIISSYEQYVKNNIPNSSAGKKYYYPEGNSLVVYEVKNDKIEISYYDENSNPLEKETKNFKEEADGLLIGSNKYVKTDLSIGDKLYTVYKFTDEVEGEDDLIFEDVPIVPDGYDGNQYLEKSTDSSTGEDTVREIYTLKKYTICGISCMLIERNDELDSNNNTEWTCFISGDKTLYTFKNIEIEKFGQIKTENGKEILERANGNIAERIN